jgi:hypothetical protein
MNSSKRICHVHRPEACRKIVQEIPTSRTSFEILHRTKDAPRKDERTSNQRNRTRKHLMSLARASRHTTGTHREERHKHTATAFQRYEGLETSFSGIPFSRILTKSRPDNYLLLLSIHNHITIKSTNIDNQPCA